MKLSFRDIKRKQFSIEAEPSALIGDVKKQVAEHESAEAAQIRLIHSGKVLLDEHTVESYGIKESDHIISMVSKPKAAPVPSQPPSTPAQSSTSAQTPAAPAPASGTSSTQNAPNTPTPASTTSASQRAFDDTSPLMGPERQAAIANMESMGFARPEIERAMRAAYFNPDRAVDFLLNGIPDHVQREIDAQQQRPASGAQQQGTGQQQQPAGTSAPAAAAAAAAPAAPSNPQTGDEPVNLFEAAAAANQGQGGGRGTAGSGGSGTVGGAARGLGGAGGAGGAAGQAGSQNLDFLRENPMFQQLRNLVQAQPSMLESVLHQVSAANPQLAQLISNNPQQFLEMLTEGNEEGTEGVPLPPGARDISVTEDERDAIERLCNLGFERDLVIQAYFACDKNEELAANFLFDQPPEEDDGGAGGDLGGAGGPGGTS